MTILPPNRCFLTTMGLICFCCLLFLTSTGSAQTTLVSLLPAVSESSDAVDSPNKHPEAGDTQSITLDSSEDAPGTSSISKNSLAELQLFIEDFSLLAYWRLEILRINKDRLFYDISNASNRLAFLSGFSSFTEMLVYLCLLFFLTFVLEWLFRMIVLRRFLKKPASCPLTWPHRIWLTLAHGVPELVSLLFFAAVSYVTYTFIYSSYFSVICPTYLSILVTIIVIRFFAIIAHLLFAPSNESIRLIRCDNATARVGYRSTILFIFILTTGMMSTNLLKYGGLEGDSLLLVKLFFGTIFIIAAGIVLFLNRVTISQWISYKPQAVIANRDSGSSSSYIWIILAIAYLSLLWVIWSSKLIFSNSQLTLVFSMSLLIIPIFLILDGLISWLFAFVKQAVSVHDESHAADLDNVPEDHEPGVLFMYLRALSRLTLIGLLFLWVLHLWNIRFAYTPAIISGIERVGFVFIIFFFLWQIIDKSIGSYLSKREAESLEEDDGGESEWGSGPLLDRSQTLLPIFRKFLGIVMLILLVLFTLSSLGVNIGPLLAGAGVVGIAIGFGAQKLVSDLLSGFFYLVDDAFRVGEYIEAESIKGTVEKITLRNLMLRHHRGMLQIIPYSDLGAITNYMRGGIVVKFNLQFPYDTDVDKVRKLIKRVGQEMLTDPELGSNFIKQLKSQGIREVGDSVLTIRAKFTAKPGTHFVIRREAYRRITEKLNEQGIYYAHRKVIVDFPDDAASPAETADEETRKKLLQAGAASALTLNSSDKQDAASSHAQS